MLISYLFFCYFEFLLTYFGCLDFKVFIGRVKGEIDKVGYFISIFKSDCSYFIIPSLVKPCVLMLLFLTFSLAIYFGCF